MQENKWCDRCGQDALKNLNTEFQFCGACLEGYLKIVANKNKEVVDYIRNNP